MVPTNKLVPYKGNAKVHDSVQIGQIAESIEEFNFADPIAAWHDKNGDSVIIEGHGRLMAAKKLGIKQLPVIYLDYLSDEQRRAYTLVHNKLTMNSDFDFEILQDELDSIFDINMADFGFDVAIDDFTEPQEIKDEEVPEPPKEPICKSGDVWKLGRHRLMCGDSTDPHMVSTLMDGNRADVCFTSPPYNMNVQTGWETAPNIAMGAGAAYGMYEDNATDSDYAGMLNAAVDNAIEFSDDAMFNVGVLSGSKYGIASMLWEHAANILDIIVWNKSQSMPHGMESQRGMLSHRCELVFCFNKSGSRSFHHPQWEKGTGINRIDTANASGNEYAKQHSATFPVEFAAEVVRNYTDKSVLDLFGGTGTTLIAAEQLGRTCYMMELDPHYCDIIIERWQNLTGEKAVKVKDA